MTMFKSVIIVPLMNKGFQFCYHVQEAAKLQLIHWPNKNNRYSCVGNPDTWSDLHDITLRKSEIVQIHCDETLIQALPHSWEYGIAVIKSQWANVSIL